MKKVLFAVHTLTGGGAERVVSVWSSKLAKMGYDVTIFTFFISDKEYPVDSNVKRTTVAQTREDYLRLNYLERYKAFRRTLKEVAPDAIISFLPTVQIWMMAANIGLKSKRIETIRISPWHVHQSWLYSKIWKMCFATGDSIILQTNEQKEFFRKRLQKKCVIVPNTVNEKYENFEKNEFPERIRNFVAAGRITEQKNYPMMIEAFSVAHEINPGINLEIYGEGNDEYVGRIQRLIDERNATDYIKLCGRTNDMPSVMFDKDAFLMTSDFEGLPNSLIEAMIAGLVCISTNCKTGPKDLISDGKNGFLVPVGDVETLVAKINRVASFNADEIKAFAEAARRDTIALCGEKNTLQKLIDAIESV